MPHSKHPASPSGNLGIFSKIFSCAVDIVEKSQGTAKYLIKSSDASTHNFYNGRLNDDLNQVILDINLSNLIKKKRYYAILVQGTTLKNEPLIDSRILWWKFDPDKNTSEIILKDLIEGPKEFDQYNIHVDAKITDNQLLVNWRFKNDIHRYNLVIINLNSINHPQWQYPVVPYSVCCYDPAKGKLIRRDNGHVIERRQDIPEIYERLGYTSVGLIDNLLDYWDNSNAYKVINYYFVANQLAYEVSNPLDCAYYYTQTI